MTIRRFVLCFVVALLLEVAVFALSHQDLLFFRQRPERLRGEPAAAFDRHARSVLARTTVPRQQLETIAAAARDRQAQRLEVEALERIVTGHPGDRGAQLRLADALRRARQFERAEQIYRQLIEPLPGGAP